MRTRIYLLSIMALISTLFSVNALAFKHIVHVGNFYFTPSSLNVNVGDTIRWVWDAGTHTTTSSTIPAGAPTWDSPISGGVQVYEYKVAVTGVHNYVCTPHAGMGQVGSFTAAGASPTLSITPSNRNVTAPAGTTSFSITSNSSWTAVSSASWCAASSGGSGNGTLFADYLENTSLNSRTATITVSVSGLPNQTVTVTQSGAAATLAVSPANQQAGAASGNTTFNVTSNTTWTASSNVGWCVVTSSGSGNGVLTATFQENTTFVNRVATITVSAAGVSSQTVTVTQDASTVGVQEKNGRIVSVVPNPSYGFFKVTTDLEPQESYEAVVVDQNGKIVYRAEGISDRELKLDLTGNAAGIYLLKFKTGNSSVIKRLTLLK